MKSIYTLIFTLVCLSLFGQKRYIDSLFAVEVVSGVTYGSNIGVLTGAPAMEELKMDIYSPMGDTETNRPVMLVAHTGSFLPPIFNGQATGGRTDLSVVHACMELASRGYVAVAYSYRLGWNPVSPDQNVRTGTLLQAAYRGIQDTRSCVRFLRKSADAGEGNEYGIDQAKIGVMGIGTGGYLAYGAGTLYDFDEVTLDKFIDSDTALPYIDSLVYGNLYGDTQAAICLPNTPGYSSEIAFGFNIGGACGDSSWVDGTAEEAALAGVHATNDIFAPFSEGPVIVPTTNEFVVNVAGTRAAIQYANEKGNNDDLATIPAAGDPLASAIAVQKTEDVTLYTGQTLKLGTDNFYAFKTPFPQGSPWDWWSYPVLAGTVAFINGQLGAEVYNADTIHMSGLATNPDMSAEKGMRYMDTIFTLMIPRACVALDLGCELTATEDLLSDSDVGLSFAPNPASDAVRFEVSNDTPIQGLRVYNMVGNFIKSSTNIHSSEYTLYRDNLQSGTYLVQLVFEEGTLTKKIIFN